MKTRFFGCLFLVLLVVLGVSVTFNLLQLSLRSGGGSGLKTPRDFDEEYVTGNEYAIGKGKVAVIDLSGVISYSIRGDIGDSMVDDILEKIRQAGEDSTVKAVVIRVDSPGGEVTASDVIYHHISLLRAKKPVVIYMNTLAASGAFYAAMGGNYIIANELTITGSIGVIMQSVNFEGLAQKLGFTLVTFKSGALKDLLNPVRPVSPEEQALVQDLINETYAKFVGIVAKERDLDVTMLRTTIADGRILSGKQALAARLIDANGYIESAYDKARTLAKLPNDAPVIHYYAPVTFGRFFRILGESEPGKIELKLDVPQLKLETGKPYYLSPHMFGGG
jgi:protease-4